MNWPAASVPYFLFICTMALVARDLPRSSRRLAIGSALVGLGVTVAAFFTTEFWLRSVVLPPLVLLIGYRASGFLWRGPMFDVEAKLIAADRALGVGELVRRTPRWLAELLEFSYAGVYPLIPVALAIHLLFAAPPDPEFFWTVVLVTDYVCFGMLPFIQTRPPRALESNAPWTTRLRGVNLVILQHASIRMNTVPSGHAAEALAAALLVLSAPAPVVVVMFVAAAAVSAGAVFGRYHYAIDIVTGWATALGVWMFFQR